MDFYNIRENHNPKLGTIEIFPDFEVTRSSDLMVRGRGFYAVWDEKRNLWSTDEYDVQRLVDADLMDYKRRKENENPNYRYTVRLMTNYKSGAWQEFKSYLQNLPDNFTQLDTHLTFYEDEVKKSDHVSKKLKYPLTSAPCDAWNELIGTLYDPSEKEKIEWAIGSIFAGDSITIQKFIVLYGEAGAGKSTVLNIIQKLFENYFTIFDAKSLTSSGNQFSTEAFKGNPLVAIQHDGDLARIEDNTKLNMIVAHELMVMNEKFKPSYTARANCFLFIGTNKPVKITDSMSGLIRRLIDVRTSGRRVSPKHYQALYSQIDFELGSIASQCLRVYRSLGKNYYSGYKPVDMMFKTDVFFNFVEANYYIFMNEPFMTLTRAYDLYKQYCDEALVEHKLPRHKFRDELHNYYEVFEDVGRVDGHQVRSVFSKFKESMFKSVAPVKEEHQSSIVLEAHESIFDKEYGDCPAQYASASDIPPKRWRNNTTTLRELNSGLLHFVKPPDNHIVIDFDLSDPATGEKSLEANLEAASKWPATYVEVSKSGKALHLHYIYDGDVSRLSHVFADGVEVKTFPGDASLRRKYTLSNNTPIAHISSGLPLKGEKVYDPNAAVTERSMRSLIIRNLNKEIHGATKPSVDFIFKIFQDAYDGGVRYDLSYMKPNILAFAAKSTHNAEYCIGLVSKMKFKSEEKEMEHIAISEDDDSDIVFFDVEVYPNLFLVVWKYRGKDKECVYMINPSGSEMEQLMQHKLVGFNNRRYDNHIIYARYLGYSNAELFKMSSDIISNKPEALMREAYNASYADVYDFSSIKQGLKAFQISLGIEHKELDLPWDQPVPEEKWHLVADYCANDVISLESVFDDRKEDYLVRRMLAKLSGLKVNDSTQTHIGRILFGNDQNPQSKFVYTNLATTFPGYTFSNGKSLYKGEDPGEGGYVYAKPGIYKDVALLDIASMHPTSIEKLNLFGDKYTSIYSQIKQARLALKHRDLGAVKNFFGGKLEPYIQSPESATGLALALKLVLNSVYGYTAAKFENKFRDPRNIDNIVAKRGALFMIDLKNALTEQGYNVVHIKTDSVKIANVTPEAIDFVTKFGKLYGYDFEYEATYDKFCLVNDAVYIARYKDGKKAGRWTATGAEFAHPFIFKTLFSKEEVTFKDLEEVRNVTSPSLMYLDLNENLPDVSDYEAELAKRIAPVGVQRRSVRNKKITEMTDEELAKKIEEGHSYNFVGRVSSFVPVVPGSNGGHLYRKKDGKYYTVTGTKGYRWLEASLVQKLGLQSAVDMTYYHNLADEAKAHIEEFGSFDKFILE